jgi:hypothetical protein
MNNIDLLLQILKQQLINNFKTHNFKNINSNLFNYIQQLENKYSKIDKIL